jgi:hypothetical protein
MDGWDESLRGKRMSNSVGRVIFKYQMPILEREELDAAAYQLSAHSNRKERRAFEARQRKRK